MCRVDELVLFRINLFVSEYFLCLLICAPVHMCLGAGTEVRNGCQVASPLSPSPLSFLFYCFSVLFRGLSLNLEVTFSSARPEARWLQ